jgi:hypothetical protein
MAISAAQIAAVWAMVRGGFEAIGADVKRIDSSAVALTNRILTVEAELGFATDPDAAAFIAAAAILNVNQRKAIINLVAAIKAIDSGVVWSKLRLIYPIVGATVLTHRLNLKNPSQFPITWSGAITHTALGAVGVAGDSGRGDTGHVPPDNEVYLGLYVNQTQGPYESVDWGSQHPTNPFVRQTLNAHWHTDLRLYGDIGDLRLGRTAAVVPTALGWSAVSSTSNTLRLYKNANLLTTATASAGVVSTGTYRLFRADNIVMCPGRTYGFAVAGASLTQSQQNALYTAIQDYQTALGRAV